MIDSLKLLPHSLPPPPSIFNRRSPRGLRLLLMCTAGHPLPPEIARLYGRGVAEGLDVGVVRLEETFFDLQSVLSYDGPMLVVLCHTADVDVGLRLEAKRQFLTYGRPCHWLCTVKIGRSAEQSWQAVAAQLARLTGWDSMAPGVLAGRARI